MADQRGDGDAPHRVARRTLSKTGLTVSEIGFGGRSWPIREPPDGRGGPVPRPSVVGAGVAVDAGGLSAQGAAA